MATGNTENHKRNKDGHPLCGRDEVGYVWDDEKHVTCTCCQLLMKLPKPQVK